MAKTKGPHHRGTHQTTAKRITDQANANPSTVCWRCGLRLDQHQPHRNGRPAYWTAGHLHDGQIDGPMAPEASTCNYSAGGKAARARDRQRRSADLTPVAQW